MTETPSGLNLGKADTGGSATATAPKPKGDLVLSVRGLAKHFPIRSKGLVRRKVGDVHAVCDVSFDIHERETVCIAGESACGKTTTGRLVLNLIEASAGSVTWHGRDLRKLSTKQMRPLRRDMQIVFQDPFGSLDPRMTVNELIAEPLRIHGMFRGEHDGRQKVRDLLAQVGLNPEHGARYSHEFSGGQRQRIGIARALALKPKLLVLDEPVSALDVSIQAGVINLLEDLQEELHLTYVFIAHDLSVVRHVSDRVAVMYLGKIVEIADREGLYGAPMHPYTTALMSAVPVPDTKRRTQRDRIRLQGDVPSPINPPPACRFHTRCWKAQDICKTQEPPLLELAPRHQVACHFPENLDAPPAAASPAAPSTAAAAPVTPDADTSGDGGDSPA